jgi:hypothetical protein
MVLAVEEEEVSVELSPYYDSDYLGLGVFFPDGWNRTVKFGVEETLVMHGYSDENESMEIIIVTEEGGETMWVPMGVEVDLDFVTIWVRGGHALECK